jgi:ketosteroid isomerase-like protein
MAKKNNVALVEDIYAAYAQGNSQFILDRITDDVDWINEGPDSIPYPETFKGPKDVQRFFEALAGTVDNGRVTAADWIAQGDKVGWVACSHPDRGASLLSNGKCSRRALRIG